MSFRPSNSDPVDLEGFRAEMREAGVEEIVPSTLEAYQEEATDHRDRLERAVAAGDMAEVSKVAHAMRSAAGAIKARVLADLLGELESAGKSETLAATESLIAAVRGEHEAVMGFLKEKAGSG